MTLLPGLTPSAGAGVASSGATDHGDFTQRLYRPFIFLSQGFSNFYSRPENRFNHRILNLLRLTLALLTLTAFSFGRPLRAEEPGRMVAFIAAVGDYPGNAALYEAIFNGERLAAGLKKSGFEVTTLFDFTLEDFDENYRKWCVDTSDSTVAIFYFCGHGGNYNQKSYLVPQGADIESASNLESQGIAFDETILKHLTLKGEAGQQLRLVLIDGFQKNPFFLGANSTDSHGLSHSGFIKPSVLGEGTVLVLPCAPGDLIKREDSRILVEVILAELFRDGITLGAGLEALKTTFNQKTGKKATSYSEISDVQGSFIFSNNGLPSLPKEKTGQPVRPSDINARLYQPVRDSAIKSLEEGDFVKAIDGFLKIYDDFPEYRSFSIDRIRGILASGDLFRNPFKGRKLIDATEFDFMRLVKDKKTGSADGLGLPEARRILWETERFFDKEKGVLWAAEDASSGDGRAMEALGKLYLEFNRNDEAFAMFKRASETLADPLESFLFLGHLHSNGLGCEKSLTKAREYYKLALQEVDGKVKGIPMAAVQLGHLEVEEQYSKPPELRNFRAAVEFYQKAVSYQEYSGAANLGQLHWSGFPGTDLDQEKGISILIEGAETGLNSRCMWVLANLFHQGLFDSASAQLRIDAAKAANYTMLAADFGYPEAIEYCKSNNIQFSGAGRKLLPNETDYQWRKLREAQAAATEQRTNSQN